MKVKEESENVGLKLTILKTKSWHLVPSFHRKYMGKLETVSDFIFGGSKMTADGDCSHEIKRRLLLGRIVLANLGSILKSKRHYFANKVMDHLVKAMVFPIVMYGCESWTIKKSEL